MDLIRLYSWFLESCYKIWLDGGLSQEIREVEGQVLARGRSLKASK